MIDKPPLESMRLDKWLWCARFFKTRALATTAVKANRINVNSTPIKSSRTIRAGDQIVIKKPPCQYTITILKLSRNRLAASAAALLYEETIESIENRKLLADQIKAEHASVPKTRGRPTKRERRNRIDFMRKAADQTEGK